MVARRDACAADARATTPRDGDAVEPWDRALEPLAGARERVFEHDVAAGDDGWCAAAIDSPATGLGLLLRWEAASLPRFHQWVHPAPGIAVLGLEPANCSVLGRAADRAAGRLPVLEPGDGARHAPGGPRRPAGLTVAAAFARVESGTSHFPPWSDSA